MSMDTSNPADDQAAAPESVRCDFCGAAVRRVRRIALDGEYERLRTPHKVRYACESCSARKEAERHERASS
jgi:uncharacterized protein with PIN domain